MGQICGKGGSGPRLADVDHPRDAELVPARAELIAPHLLLQGDRHGAAFGQLLPVAAQLICVVTAEAHRDVVSRVVFISGGVSAPMSVNPLSVSSMPCMILSAYPESGAPNSPKVLSVKVPPKTRLENSMACRPSPVKLMYGLRREDTGSSMIVTKVIIAASPRPDNGAIDKFVSCSLEETLGQRPAAKASD